MKDRFSIRSLVWASLLALAITSCNNLQPPKQLSPEPTIINSPLPSAAATTAATALPAAAATPPTTSVTTTAVLSYTGGTGNLAFSYEPGGVFQIGLMNMATEQVKELTSSKDPGDAEPTWSPDGKYILFNSGRNKGTHFEIYRMNADGSDQKLVITSDQGGNYSPSYSPDGKKIVFHTNRDGNMEVYTANADGSNPVNLTKNGANDGTASWSPDGSKIVFSSDRSGEYQTYVMNADGSDTKLLFDHKGWSDLRPRYSPDGKHIVFGTQQRYASDYHLAMIDSDGSHLAELTGGTGEYAQAAWIGNNKLVYSGRKNDSEKWQLFVLEINPDGGIFVTPLSLLGNDYRNPSWTK